MKVDTAQKKNAAKSRTSGLWQSNKIFIESNCSCKKMKMNRDYWDIFDELPYIGKNKIFFSSMSKFRFLIDFRNIQIIIIIWERI